MSECSDNIDSVKRVKHILHNDELLEGHGLTVLSTVDKRTGVCLSHILPRQSHFSRNVPGFFVLNTFCSFC